LLALACAGRNVTSRPPNAPRTRSAAVVGDTQTGGLFPQIGDSSRRLDGGAFRAAAKAPPCTLPAVIDSSEWHIVATNERSKYLQAVTLTLPTRFRQGTSHFESEIPEGSIQFWGHSLGSWDAGGVGPDIYIEDIGFWIGPNEGYPTVGVAGDDRPEQKAVSECVLKTAVGLLPVVLFDVRSPSLPFTMYYVGTYWALEPDVYITAQGQASDSVARSQLLAALATIRVER